MSERRSAPPEKTMVSESHAASNLLTELLARLLARRWMEKLRARQSPNHA